MNKNTLTGGLDYAKIAAALLVVAIHTSPLASFSANADLLLTRVIARIAVPFFLMVSGYFILPGYVFRTENDPRLLCAFLKKTLLLYAVAILIYLPVNVYAGQLNGLGWLGLLRLLIFDGTLYHLWYLPATALGLLLVYALSRYLPFSGQAGVVLLLYALGLLGDSYYGLLANAPGLSSVYAVGFEIFSYTRNGLFYAPLFLLLGAGLGRREKRLSLRAGLIGSALSLAALLAEGLLLHRLGLPRHDSMYVTLPLVMFFLYQLALAAPLPQRKSLRLISTWIYLIHPLMIVAVRGAAKLLGLTPLLVENSLVHYIAVCLASVAFAVLIQRLTVRLRQRRFPTGRAWIELDMAALRHNVETLKALLPSAALMPALKANAYGHGVVPVAKELNRLGVNAFCVATVQEGVELRRHGIRGEILILGYTHPEQFPLLRRYRLTQTVIDAPYAQALDKYGQRLRVQVGVDTGMRRLGMDCADFDHILNIFRLKNLRISGMFTHLCADDRDDADNRAFTARQAADFEQLKACLREQGYAPKTHILSSYGLINCPQYGGDHVRVGVALYGVLSSRADTLRCGIDLQPMLSLKARVASVRALQKGENAGYGLVYIAPADRKIATLTIGYGDGLPRSLSCGVGQVLIRGCKAPIVGRICMDQTLVDVSDVPGVSAGDIAVLIGTDGPEELSVYDLAEQSGTITNEILSRLGSRLERVVK